MSAHVPPNGFLTRANRRRVERLAPQVGKMTDADARFFDRFPARRHRVRLASEPEVVTDHIVKGISRPPLYPGARWVAIIKQLAPGVRIRLVEQSIGRDGNDFDMPETLARWAYDEVVRPGTYLFEKEQAMAAAVAKLGAPR